MLVATFSRGLFLIDSLAGTKPSARLVSSFPTRKGADCVIPVVAGNHDMVAVPAWRAVVSLDISDPTHPPQCHDCHSTPPTFHIGSRSSRMESGW